MKVKASLHLHSSEDEEDSIIIDYSLFELIDHLAALDFKVMASTGHSNFVCKPEHFEYAKKKGILLISGIEANIEGHKHVLILNVGTDAEKVRSFDDLKRFKRKHPESFIIAPHPNHGAHSITLGTLRKMADIIDAVEHSWFYTRSINPNRRTGQVSGELGLPFIATADAHVLDHLNTDYAVIEIEKLTVEAVFGAIRKRKFVNKTRPKNYWEIFKFLLLMVYGNIASLFVHN